MNEIVDKFLLTGDKFMPEMHLKQPRFTFFFFFFQLAFTPSKTEQPLQRMELQE